MLGMKLEKKVYKSKQRKPLKDFYRYWDSFLCPFGSILVTTHRHSSHNF